MKPLESIVQMLTWLSAYPPDERTSKTKKLLYIFIFVVIMAVLICGFIAFATFFFKYIMSDLEKALMAVMTLCTATGTSYTLVVSFVKRLKMKSIFDDLSEIYEKCKHPSKRYALFQMVLRSFFPLDFRQKRRIFPTFGASQQPKSNHLENLF